MDAHAEIREKAYEFVMARLSEGVNFHPDTPFEDYVNIETGERTYDDETAARLTQELEDIMLKMEFGSQAHDIYRIGLNAMRDFMGWKAENKSATHPGRWYEIGIDVDTQCAIETALAAYKKYRNIILAGPTVRCKNKRCLHAAYCKAHEKGDDASRLTPRITTDMSFDGDDKRPWAAVVCADYEEDLT